MDFKPELVRLTPPARPAAAAPARHEVQTAVARLPQPSTTNAAILQPGISSSPRTAGQPPGGPQRSASPAPLGKPSRMEISATASPRPSAVRSMPGTAMASETPVLARLVDTSSSRPRSRISDGLTGRGTGLIAPRGTEPRMRIPSWPARLLRRQRCPHSWPGRRQS